MVILLEYKIMSRARRLNRAERKHYGNLHQSNQRMDGLQIKEWTDYENQYKIAVAAVKWLDKHLKIVHGKRESNVELTYGLPYTSSGEYAAIWNTNVDARSNDDPNLAFKGVALDKDNNPVIIWRMTDCDGWKYEAVESFQH